MLKTILKLCTINALIVSYAVAGLLKTKLNPESYPASDLQTVLALVLQDSIMYSIFIYSKSKKNIKFINNKCRCIIYLPLICAQIVSFMRQIRRKPFRLQLERANPRWISLLLSSLGIPSDHSVYKKLQTTVSSWVLLSYSHDTLATPVTFLRKQLHTHTSYCCGRVCVEHRPDSRCNTTGCLEVEHEESQSVSISLWKFSSGWMHSVFNSKLRCGRMLALWVDHGATRCDIAGNCEGKWGRENSPGFSHHRSLVNQICRRCQRNKNIYMRYVRACSHTQRDDSLWRLLEVMAEFPLMCTKRACLTRPAMWHLSLLTIHWAASHGNSPYQSPNTQHWFPGT